MNVMKNHRPSAPAFVLLLLGCAALCGLTVRAAGRRLDDGVRAATRPASPSATYAVPPQGQKRRRPRAQAQRPRASRGAREVAAAKPVPVIELETLKQLMRRGAPAPAGQGAPPAAAQPAPRPLLINFWATWCGPCREEFPDFVRLSADYERRGGPVQFAFVSLDDPSEVNTTVPQFLRQVGADKLPAYLLNVIDTEAAIAAVDPEWAGNLPATYLIDSRGQIIYKHFGRINPDELRANIERTLNGGAE